MPDGVVVFGANVPDNEFGNRVLSANGVDGRVLKGLQGTDSYGNDGMRSVNAGHCQDEFVTTRLIRPDSVSEARLTSGLTGGNSESSPPQGAKGVRRICTSLGSDALGRLHPTTPTAPGTLKTSISCQTPSGQPPSRTSALPVSRPR